MKGRAAFGENRKLSSKCYAQIGLRNRCNPMAESHDKDRVDGTCWVEDLQWRFGWLRV